MSHTPGPWTTEPHGGTTALYSGRGPQRHGLRLMNLDDGDANFEDNIRLIAAAPGLLSALKHIAEGDRDHLTDWKMVFAVIAKAEGRS